MKKMKIKLWSVIFWLALWQLISMYMDEEILLVSPIKVILCLCELVTNLIFWKSILFSFIRISAGFFLAALIGVVLAMLSARFTLISELLAPIMLAIKSVPVVSFIILALIWFSSKNLSVLISFMMVLPIIYTNTLTGIKCLDKDLAEMSKVFNIPTIRRIRYIEAPQVMPYIYSACEIGLGLCWKSGIAAEVIGIPKGSIGERLQQAKVYLDTPDLFAWTVVIVLLSCFFERLVLCILKGCNHLWMT
jgi:NitT/TauT family transport system permease protein